MTHRWLCQKRWSLQHQQQLVGLGNSSPASQINHQSGCGNHQHNAGTAVLLAAARPFSHFSADRLAVAERKLRIAQHRSSTTGTGFSSTIFSTFRPQSTTPETAVCEDPRESMLKKRKRFRTKFAELIQMNNAGTLTHSKATVKKLKHKQLATFIARSDVLAGTDASGATAASASASAHVPPKKPEYIRGKKHSLIEMGPPFVQRIELTGDEMPFLFVGKKLVRFERGSPEVQQIVDSYMLFKELSVDGEDALAADEATDYCDTMIHTKRSASRQSDHHNLDVIDPYPAPNAVPAFDLPASNPTKSRTSPSRSNTATAAPPSVANSSAKSHHKSHEHELMSRHKSLVHNLTVYLELCVQNHGMINRGVSTLLGYRSNCLKSGDRLNIVDVGLYNILLGGFATVANLGKIRELMAIMREDNIRPTAATFATVFECLARTTPASGLDVKRLLHEYETEAERANITLNDIMADTKFVGDQREIVLGAIRMLQPDFVPVYKPPATYYENVLMNQLNEHLRPLSERLDPNPTEPVAGSEITASKHGFSADELTALAEKQLQIELDSVIVVPSVQSFSEPTEQVLRYRQRLADLHGQWRQQITSAFNRDLNTLRSQMHSKGNRSVGLYPYLRCIDVDDYASVLLTEARILSEGSETFSLTVGALYKRIGTKVQSKYYMERKRHSGVLAKTRNVYADYVGSLCGQYSADNPRQSWQRHVHHAQTHGPSMDIVDVIWPSTAVMGVGRFLFQILMRDVKIDANALRPNSRTENVLPAFYTLFRNEGKYVKEEVKPHPVLAKLFRGSQQEVLHFDSNTVPMLCPPQPWSTPQNGGYLLARSDLIRLPNQAHQQWERIASTDPVQMYPSLDSLNQLSNIAWRVNTTVLDIILKVFGDGGSKKLDVPQPPSALPPLEEMLAAHKAAEAAAAAVNQSAASAEKVEAAPLMPSKTDLYNRFRQKLLHRRKQSEMYSLWCDTLYRLSLANHFRSKVFWLPHNMDFRGRVYPIPPHLNHLGSDLARCLLVFNQARPLGPDGYAWLKLHCINLTGFKKKQAVAERLRYADECMDDILDSADHPLDGRMWWSTSDEPWQTLAACIEIARVHRSGRPPAEFLSSFPIHQDGSCNGLQHYAALGRDTAGAISVNLAPCDVPQDVYSDVAALVETARRTDASNGVEVARILDGFIRRSVIKQTVMTTVYGVTRFGARTQIARQLKDIDEFPKDWVWPASTYLTTKTFESLREMFTSTREIQDWFTHCARLISGVGGHNVAWTTPLGLPIVQPYNRFEFNANPKSNRLSAEHMNIDTHLKPNVMKQKNAFPPNFIHSLDSSHMMLTSLHCEKRGLTFMSVHDCYWTHACSVAAMNRVCREQFVALHSQPILEDLSDDLAARYGYQDRDFTNDGSVLDSTRHKLNRALLQMPAKGDFDLRNVLESVYFFS